MLKIEISRMDEKTVEDVARLERQCFQTPWSLESLKTELENPLAVFLTAGMGGEITGYAGMHDVAGEGYITNVAVAPEHRRRGIAKMLIESLLAYGAKNGLEMITLEVRESNVVAIELYRGLGFVEKGCRKNFYTQPVEDGIIMTRILSETVENPERAAAGVQAQSLPAAQNNNRGVPGLRPVKILAIETSCDETAAAVVEDGRRVLASVIYSQIEEHKIYGGVVPEIASRRHTEQIVRVVRQALEQAGTSLDEIGAVAVTAAPGLIGALLVGVNFAKGLCLSTGKPLVAVHHIRGHIAANYIAHPELEPPFVCLVASGGHSHIVEVTGYMSFRVLGRTRDDAAGEAFDKVARVLGLPYPGGVHVDMAAGSGDAAAHKLPRPTVPGNPYDFSFSGLKTAVVNLVHNLKQKEGELSEKQVSDIAASFRETACCILAERFIAAARDAGCKKLVLAGGVSANSRLRKMLGSAAAENGFELFMPPLWLCGDNAAMIGAQGWYEYEAGNIAAMDLNAQATWPVETKL